MNDWTRKVGRIVLLLSLTAGRLLGQTYYVDPAGSDAANGQTPGSAWKTLAKVNATTFLPGDSILFKSGGSWTGQLKPKGSGAENNPIVIDLYGGAAKPLILGGGVIGQAAVYLSNQQYWEINNLEITNDAATAGDRRGVLVAAANFGTVHHIYLRNLYIHNVKGIVGQDDAAKRTAGIGIETTDDATPTRFDDILIEGCVISSIENTGIYTDNLVVRNNYPGTSAWLARRFTNVRIRNNVIHHISKNAMICRLFDGGVVEHNVCYETALQTTGNTIFTATCDGTVFQYNEGYLNRSPGADGSLYDPDLRSPRTVWQYSYSHDNAHGLLWTCTVQEDSGVICRYNISQNDKGNIFCINYPNTSVYCYNNTVYIGAGVNPTIISERNVNAGTRNYVFQNNIIVNMSSGATYDFRTSGYTRSIGYNIFYGNHPANEPADAHKLTSNPGLVAGGTGGNGFATLSGYQLQAGSPAINSGQALFHQPAADFWGNAVPSGSGVDRGAHERPAASTFTLSTTAVHGSIAKNPDLAAYDSNATVRLTAVPDGGYHFIGWGGALSGLNNPDSVIMSSNLTVSAMFEQNSSPTFRTWTGAGGDGLWSNAANWSTGSAPGASDTVVLDHASVPGAYAVSVTAAGSTCRSLTVGSAVTLMITGATATLVVGDSVAGNEDIVIQSGGEIQNLSTAGTGVTPFLLRSSVNDRFRIQDGGKYFHDTPRGFSTPFPAGSCLFAPNSTVEYARLSPAQPPMSGRTYGNLVFSSPTRKSITATSTTNGFTVNGTMTIADSLVSFFGNWTSVNPITVNALVHHGDTLSLTSSTSPITVGNVTTSGLLTSTTGTSLVAITGNVTNSGVISFGSPLTVQCAGNQPQTIGGSGTIPSIGSLSVSNAAGVSFTSDCSVTGGSLALGAGVVTMADGATLSLAPGAGTTRTSGFVVGRLRKHVPGGPSSAAFEIGDAGGTYTPVSVTFANVAVAGELAVATTAGDHPEIIASGIDPVASVNRTYALEADGIGFTSADITFTFGANDVDAGADPLAFEVRRYSAGAWSAVPVGARTPISVTTSGAVGFGEFQIGDTSTITSYTITATAGPHGTISPSGAVTITAGGDTAFVITPDPGFRQDSLIVDGVNIPDSVGRYTFYSVVSDRAIRAVFAADECIVPLERRWNLVSLPYVVADPRVTSVFAGGTTPAYTFQQGYVAQETLRHGVGYWIKYAQAESVSITGTARFTDTVAVVAGWNLIGSLSRPVASAQIASVPPGIVVSHCFGYDGAYVIADTLRAGRGYWVKVSNDGLLIISAGAAAQASQFVKQAVEEFPPPPPQPKDTGLPEEER